MKNQSPDISVETIRRGWGLAKSWLLPNIITIHEIGETDSTHYLVTEAFREIQWRTQTTA
jgi:hypothetical protein